MANSSLQSFSRQYVPRPLRNALRHPPTTLRRLWKKFRFVSGQTDQVEVREGWTLRCHPLCVEGFSHFKTDPSQQAELDAFVAHCAPGMHLLDLGAHWGFLTLASLHFGGPTARSVAVEPSAAAAALLEINLKLNAYTNRAILVNKAAGQEPGTIEMLTTGAGGNDYFIVPSEKRPDVLVVPQTTIGRICAELAYRPTHVKIDVEGFEEEVMLGGKDFLAEYRPMIFLELHGDLIQARGKDPAEPLRLLESFGYRRFEQDGQAVTMQQLAQANYIARLVCTMG